LNGVPVRRPAPTAEASEDEEEDRGWRVSSA
jgi:hypothetical protein